MTFWKSFIHNFFLNAKMKLKYEEFLNITLHIFEFKDCDLKNI